MNMTNKLDNFFNSYFAENNLDCLAVAAANAGEMVYEFYKSNAEKSEYSRFDEYTKLDIGSLAQIYIGIIIIRLIEEGKITADDLVKEYIPEFKYDNVRIIHLLTHTSGLFEDKQIDLTKIKSEKELFEKVYALPRHEVEPGSQYLYCGFGYTILMDIIQRTEKNDIETIADDIIYRPLGLKRTSFVSADENHYGITIMPDNAGNVINLAKVPTVGGSCAYSVPTELLKTGNLFLNYCKGRGNGVLSKVGFDFALSESFCSRDILRTPLFYVKKNNMYTPFADLSAEGTFGIFGNTGCALSIDPKNDVSIVIATNSMEFNRNSSNSKKIINKIMSCF